MHGPEQLGRWSSHESANCGADTGLLRAGRRYRVIKAFVDFDGDGHPVGECWTFLGYSFVPHDDGMSWFVSLDGEREWLVRLQWRAEAQAEVLEHLAEHLAEDA